MLSMGLMRSAAEPPGWKRGGILRDGRWRWGVCIMGNEKSVVRWRIEVQERDNMVRDEGTGGEM